MSIFVGKVIIKDGKPFCNECKEELKEVIVRLDGETKMDIIDGRIEKETLISTDIIMYFRCSSCGKRIDRERNWIKE